MIRSLATAATSSRVGSKNGNRIEGASLAKAVLKSSTPLRLGWRPGHLPDQCDNGASKNSALNSNNEAQSPSSVNSPCLRFRSRRGGRPHRFPLRQSLTLSVWALYGVVRTVSTRKDAARSSSRRVLALSSRECQSWLSVGPKTRAENQGISPEAGIAGQPGAKPMKFRPLHDRVVIRGIEGEVKTKGGIIIPDTAKEKPQEGEVFAVGPGARDA